MKTPRFGHLSFRAAFMAGLLCCACLGAAYRVVQNLQDLNNVRLPAAPSNNDALIYNNTLGVWTNGTVSGGFSALNQNQFDTTSTNIKSSPFITNGFFYSSGTTNWPLRVVGTNGNPVYFNKNAQLVVPATDGTTWITDGTLSFGRASGRHFISGGGVTFDGGPVYADGNAVGFSGNNQYFIGVGNYATIRFSSTGGADGTADIALYRNAANALAVLKSVASVDTTNRAAVLAGNFTARAGTSTTTYNAGGIIVVDTTQTGNVGAGVDTLQTNSITANTLAANGDTLSFEANGTFANNANNKAIVLNWGTTALVTLPASTYGIGSATAWRIEGRIIRTGAATQKAFARVSLDQSDVAGGWQTYTTPTNTLSSAVGLWITGEATDTNDVVKEMLTVEFKPAP